MKASIRFALAIMTMFSTMATGMTEFLSESEQESIRTTAYQGIPVIDYNDFIDYSEKEARIVNLATIDGNSAALIVRDGMEALLVESSTFDEYVAQLSSGEFDNPFLSKKDKPKIVCEPGRCASAVMGGALSGALGVGVAAGAVYGPGGALVGGSFGGLAGGLTAYGTADSCKKRKPEKCGE